MFNRNEQIYWSISTAFRSSWKQAEIDHNTAAATNSDVRTPGIDY